MSTLQVFSASAGAGKTFKLALKYITLLLGYMKEGKLVLFKGDDLRRHREILAITFTNKATQEMRRRIIYELAFLAVDINSSSYRKELHRMVCPEDHECIDTDIDRQISLAAQRALDSMIFDYGEMQISTIDAFFQRVLRSFAYEADLAGNYELMLENKQMTNMAVSDLLAHACGMKGVIVPKNLNSEYLKTQVQQLIVNQAKEGHEYKVFSPDSKLRKDITNFIENLSDEDYLTKNLNGDIEAFLSTPNAISDLINSLNTKRTELVNQLSTEADAVLECSAKEFISANATKFFTNAATKIVNGTDSAYLRHILISLNYAACLKKGHSESMLADFSAKVEPFAQTFRTIKSIDALTNNAKFLGLFREILQVRQELKAHLNTILLSDTNELLHRIIDDCDTPFIYERIGRKIHHFLIDEFQDTSRMQWSNLRPLLAESLSQGNENLIIGDVKQCIYRFRNSSPELLDHEIQCSPGIADYVDEQTLGENWRSAPVVVNFNNELFGHIVDTANVTYPKAESYNSVYQIPRKTEIPGYVDIDLYNADKEKEKPLSRMIEHINRQLHSGYTPGDIVVLTRTNKEAHTCVDALFNALNRGLLPPGTMVVSDEALNISSAQSVKWIVNRLHEVNGLAKINNKLNRRGLRPTTDEDIDWLQESMLRAKAEGVENTLEEVIRRFNDYRKNSSESNSHRLIYSDGRTVVELVEQLIHELPDPTLKRTEVQYICAFQDLVLDYCRHKAPTLQGFLKQWDEEFEEKATVGLADGVNAIRVMTIHKSKGLEFNCVHIPMVKRKLDKDENTHWYDVEDFFNKLKLDVVTPKYYPLESGSESATTTLKYTTFADKHKVLTDDQTIDEINALYVAFTRARQELIVSIQDPRSDSKNSDFSNHPFGVLCPTLKRMAGNTDAPWTFGSPTQKYIDKVPKKNLYKIYNTPISKYETRECSGMWSHTHAAKTSDSGEKI